MEGLSRKAISGYSGRHGRSTVFQAARLFRTGAGNYHLGRCARKPAFFCFVTGRGLGAEPDPFRDITCFVLEERPDPRNLECLPFLRARTILSFCTLVGVTAGAFISRVSSSTVRKLVVFIESNLMILAHSSRNRVPCVRRRAARTKWSLLFAPQKSVKPPLYLF